MKLTEVEIRKAVSSGRSCVLSDGKGKGTGRLVLIIRKTAEWYIRVQRDGKRQSVKVGSFPEMSLSEAREQFKSYSEGIAQGKSVKASQSVPIGTLGDLFDGYLSTLVGRASHDDSKPCLERMASSIGKHRAANSITTDDIVAFLRPVYRRGKVRMADKYRGLIRAAFSWGMKSESDYRREVEARFKLAVNPAASIPTEGVAVGTRHLSVEEFRELWSYLGTSTTHRAIRHTMFTGLRPGEIVRIHSGMIQDGLLTWEETKNGKPHTLPWWGEEFSGLLLPSDFDKETPVQVEVVYSVIWRYCRARKIHPFNLRDLRRTWKTLAGEAGISKELRDVWQNHAGSDVSSVHYDRYRYLPEKRQVLDKWRDWFGDKIGTPPY